MKERRMVLNSNTPESFITINKQRLKNVLNSTHTNSNGTVHMDDGSEFEIEIFNPYKINQLVKITINGFDLGSGLIIKPGQRIFLERYIDTNKKFRFETYEVENTPEILESISGNGEVKVSFFDEIPPVNLNTISNVNNQWNNIWNNRIMRGSIIGSEQTYDLFSNNTKSFNTTLSSSINTSIETGRVGYGSESSQNFTEGYGNYKTTPSITYVWKILPKSREVITSEDLIIYCDKCGRKKKQKENFCPKCGNKF